MILIIIFAICFDGIVLNYRFFHMITNTAVCSYFSFINPVLPGVGDSPPEVFLRKGVLKICNKLTPIPKGENTHAEG